MGMGIGNTTGGVALSLTHSFLNPLPEELLLYSKSHNTAYENGVNDTFCSTQIERLQNSMHANEKHVVTCPHSHELKIPGEVHKINLS